MQVRCYKCRWSFRLHPDTIATILEEVKESGASHYVISCPQCRNTIKVPVKQLRRFHRPRREQE
jgi:hypothetical protein